MNIRSRKSGDIITKNLLNLISRGTIKPGDKLPSIENLAKRFETSVISAREALQALEAIGLVKIQHGRGIFITNGGPIIVELLEARKTIESYNSMMAAQNISDSELKKLEDLLQMMTEDLRIGDTDSFSERDYEFHLLIGKASGNRILFKALENIRGLLYYQQSTINRFPGILESSNSRHWEIFHAIKKRDSDSSSSIMAQHIDEIIESWKKYGPSS
jgi:GntR family transcriptional repressor for pyruvate dehydrogenase complex